MKTQFYFVLCLVFCCIFGVQTKAQNHQTDNHNHEDCELKIPTTEMMMKLAKERQFNVEFPKTIKASASRTGKFEIGILFLFDEGAERYAINEKKTTLEDFAKRQIEKFNEVFVNSKIENASFRVAGIEKIASNYGSLGASQTLDYLTNLSRSEFGRVNMRRELSGGDVVVMFIDPGINSRMNGAAWALQGTPSSHKHMAMAVCGIRPSDQGYTAVHEVGHVLGCGHSRTQISNPGHGARHSYSVGYQNKITNGEYFSTIMAYEAGRGGIYFPRIPYFSSPLISHPKDPQTKIGTEQIDNARTLNQYARLTSENYPVTKELQISTEFIPAEEKEKSYDVFVKTSEEWMVASADNWVTFNQNSFTSGDKLVVTVQQNPTPDKERETTLTLKNASGEVKTIRVRQALSLKTVLDNDELDWESDGTAEWYGQSEIFSTNGKGNAARSGNFTKEERQVSNLKTKVVGPGTIKFDYKVESEGGFFGGGRLGLMIDDDYATYPNRDQYVWYPKDGETDTGWKTESYNVPEGEHLLTWVFTGAIGKKGKGFVDNVRWEYDRTQLVLGETSADINEKGQTVTVNFRTGNAWTASINADWVKLSQTSGNIGKSIDLVVSPNGGRNDRQAILTITNGTNTVAFHLNQRSDLLRAGMNADNLDWVVESVPVRHPNDLLYITGYKQPWSGQKEELYNNHPTAVMNQTEVPDTSYNIPLNVSTELVGPGTLSFKYKNNLLGRNSFYVEINGTKHDISSSAEWVSSPKIDIPKGKVVLKFVATISSAGNGKLYVTDVDYTSPISGILVEPLVLNAKSTEDAHEVKIITKSAWKSELSADWFSILPSEGTLTVKPTVEIKTNTTGETREGFILLKTKDSFEKIKITQNADENTDRDTDLNNILPKQGTDPIYFKNDRQNAWTPVFWNGFTLNPSGAMKSPTLGVKQKSTITAEVFDSGELSFDFSTELYHENPLVLYIDGKKISYFHSQKDKSTGQQSDSGMLVDRSLRSYKTKITGDGKHIISWSYERNNDTYAFSGGLRDMAILENVNYTADQKTYLVTVKNGLGEGRYKENEKVEVKADTAPRGWLFEKWEGDTAELGIDASKEVISFNMPKKEISLIAVYQFDIKSLNSQDIVKDKFIVLYPNPTNGIFYIKTEIASRYALYNASGGLVKLGNLKVGENTIDITKLPIGVYFVKMENKTFKIIKK